MRLVHAFCLACLNLRNDARKGSILKCAPRLFSCTHHRREALRILRYTTLVRSLRTIKEQWQIIIVTHNANITVPSYAATKCVDIDFALN
jgi:hypothetical protein